MYLFVDTLSDPSYIALFDEERKIVDSQTWTGKRKEFDTLVEEIDKLLSKNTLPYKDIGGIVVIIGPGSFTGTRVTTLAINAINYSFGTPLFPLTVGEFFALQDAPLPWISPVTKKEVLLWTEKKPNDYMLERIEKLKEKNYSSLSQIDFIESESKIVQACDYDSVIKRLGLETPSNRIQPLYAKTPNITTPSLHAGNNTRHQ